MNLTGASRAPALEELFNFGPHPGNLAFEVGNPDLDVERTFGVDVSLRGRGTRSRAEITVFNYNIANFVFLDVTDEIEDGLRVSNYLQADSRFTGVDGAVHLHLGQRAENDRRPELRAGEADRYKRVAAANPAVPGTG